MSQNLSKRAGVALLIGIGEYLHADRIDRLAFAARDARAMARLFVDPEICGFPKEQVVLLTHKRARRDKIVHRLSKWLPAQAKGADIVVIFFAGHGMVYKMGTREDGYLLPYDADPDDIVTRGVAMSDVANWIDATDASAVVVFLDCCHAGKVIFREGASLRSCTRDLVIGPAALEGLKGRRRFLIASCDEGQKSVESPERQHGLFTYHLLQGIAGAGDSDRDGKVEIAELFNYVSEAVAKEAREKFGREQKPWTSAIWTEHVYISSPKVGQDWSTQVGSIARRWREDGAAAAMKEFEQAIQNNDDQSLLAILRFLRTIGDPTAVPFIFRCLAHRSEVARQAAKKALQTIGWEKAVVAIEQLAGGADEAKMESVLEGLAALEAHASVVSVLDRLVDMGIVKGNLRNRAIRLLERKRLSLEQEKVAALFREIRCPYQIQRVLGQGLFTGAYLARDEVTGLDVVIRILRPEFIPQPHIRAQFLELGKKSIRFVHQNLVLTREVRPFPDRNVYYTVRDYIHGVTLQEMLESRKKFEPLQVIEILRQVLHALTPLHRDEEFHGGIKPSNIFICGDNRVVLGDPSLPLKGIVVVLERLSYDYRYVPPEMLAGERLVGPQSDFYALGCVMYELACGQPPFVSDNYTELLIKHIHVAMPLPSQKGSGLGAAGDRFLGRLLAKNPSDRFHNLAEALNALDKLQETLQKPEQPSVRLLDDASLGDYQAQQSVISLTGPAPETDLLGPVSEPPEHIRDRVPEQLDPYRKQLGPYRILKRLGQGGFGTVYLAKDTRLGRSVAMKVSRPIDGNRQFAERFSREASALAKFQHPNICAIYDVGESNGIFYLVMPFIEGQTLAEVLRKGDPLPPREAAELVLHLANTLQFAHQQGVIHRDLKPSNIILDPRNEPVIMDFGVARLLELNRDEAKTQTMEGQIVGTPAYMAPEQAEGNVQAIGPATDIYSLGMVLYELLTGRLPFRAATVLGTLQQVRSQEPMSPRQLQPKVPRDLEAICLKCLRKEPRRRYASAEALAEDLTRFLGNQPLLARPVSIWERAWKRLKRWGRQKRD
jgi:serine/threonine protein kinase